MQMAQQAPQNKLVSTPLMQIENFISPTTKTPVKTRAISSHMMQNRKTYSQPCSTIVFSPIKPLISPLELKASGTSGIQEERDFGTLAYRLQNEKMSQILKEKELVIFELKSKVKDLDFYRAERENNAATLKSLEMKIHEVLEENQKLNQLLAERETPRNPIDESVLAEFKREMEVLRKEKERLKEEKDRVESAFRESQRLLEGKQAENEKIKEELEERNKETEVFTELISKSEALILENEKLNIANLQNASELELWRQKFLQLEKSLSLVVSSQKSPEDLNLLSENSALKEKVRALVEESRRFNDFFSGFQKEKEDLLASKQLEISRLSDEVIVFRTALEEKSRLYNELKGKVHEREMDKENSGKGRMGSGLKNEYQQQMVELQRKLEVVLEENEKLNSVLDEKNKSGGNVEDFLKVNERLVKALQAKREEAELWRRKYQDIVKQ